MATATATKTSDTSYTIDDAMEVLFGKYAENFSSRIKKNGRRISYISDQSPINRPQIS